MDVQLKTKDLTLSPPLRDFITERVAKLERFLGQVHDAKLELVHERPRTGGDYVVAQLTIHTGRTILRAEERHGEAKRAIDLVVEKMERQIKRLHSKRTTRGKRGLEQPELPTLSPTELAALAPDDADTEETPAVVRTKRFALKPMSSLEAIDHLELLGHDFFVFRNADDDRVNVLYRRKSGNYGLIQPT